MLFLFDIDATILKSSRSSLYAMSDAMEDVFGKPAELEGIEFAGRLDPLIIADILRANDCEENPELLAAYIDAYARRLQERLDVAGTAYLLPGVKEILGQLFQDESKHLGLVTGNLSRTGFAKLQATGIDSTPFKFNAFADDADKEAPHRRQLPAFAIKKFEAHFQRDLDRKEAIVIGDTPHDVDCAHANGIRAVGVATGLHSRAELSAAGADLVLNDLDESAELWAWLKD